MKNIFGTILFTVFVFPITATAELINRMREAKVFANKELARGGVLDPWNHPSFTEDQAVTAAKNNKAYKASLARLKTKYGY